MEWLCPIDVSIYRFDVSVWSSFWTLTGRFLFSCRPDSVLWTGSLLSQFRFSLNEQYIMVSLSFNLSYAWAWFHLFHRAAHGLTDIMRLTMTLKITPHQLNFGHQHHKDFNYSDLAKRNSCGRAGVIKFNPSVLTCGENITVWWHP